MTSRKRVLVIDTGFPEVKQLAAELASEDILSCYVRPYANLGRGWELALAGMPGFGRAYSSTLRRRVLPKPLNASHVEEAAVGLDFATAIHGRIPFLLDWNGLLRNNLIARIGDEVALAGAKKLSNEDMVFAGWHCALPAFEKAARRDAVRVLSYPLAHHAFTSRYLQEEARLEPTFSATLDNHDLPRWRMDRLDQEIELANHIVVGSEFVKGTFIAEGVSAEKLTVIPYGADTSLFHPCVSQRSGQEIFSVLFVGQISQRKGLSYLLRAYERIQGPRTSLTLVGRLHKGDGGRCLEGWQHILRHIPQTPRFLFHAQYTFVLEKIHRAHPRQTTN